MSAGSFLDFADLRKRCPMSRGESFFFIVFSLIFVANQIRRRLAAEHGYVGSYDQGSAII